MTLPPELPLPPAVQMLAWLYRPTAFFDLCQARYGDIFVMRLPGYAPRVMIAEPDAIKAVFAGDTASLHGGAANALVAPIVGPRSVVVLDGAEHRRQRQFLLSAFGARRVVEHCAIMRELTDEAIASWPVGSEFFLFREMTAITLRVMMATLFGVRDSALFQPLYDALLELLSCAHNPLLLAPALQRDLGPLTPWRRFVALNRKLDALLQPIYEERRQQRRQEMQSQDAGPARNVLASLVTARDEEGRLLSAQEMHDVLVTLLVAGHETTAAALAWAIYHVLTQDAVRDKLRVELAAVVGDEPVEHRHLERLVYLDATVREALRLTPPIGHIGRVVQKPFPLGRYTVPPGWIVTPCIYLVHHNPRIFPEPRRFDPDRFLGKRLEPHTFLPFGGGARRCIGMSFALHEMKIILATVLQRTDLALRPGHSPRVARRGIIWMPKGGLPVQQLRQPRPRK